MTEFVRIGRKLGKTMQDGQIKSLLVFCLGCDSVHVIPVPRWTWDGNGEVPTVTPSVSIKWGNAPDSRHCHFNVTNGQIVYHGDTTHEYAGKTIDMPEIPDEWF